MPGSFIDTDVLIYIASDDPAKADRAEQVVKAGGRISVRVLNELTHICRAKCACPGKTRAHFCR